jgi:hypothetical protein
MGFLEDLVDPLSSDRHQEHMGKGGDPAQNPYAVQLAELSKKLFEQTDPLRTGLIDRSNAFVSGNMDITASPMYAGLKSAVDSQFGRARDNTIARTAAGGGLTDALVDLETGRANTMAQGTGQLASDEMNRAMGLGTGLLPIGSGGLGQAANLQGQQIAMQQQQDAQAKQGAGAGVGMLAALLI